MKITMDHPLFKIRSETLPVEQRICLSYERAVLLGKTSGLKAQDCVHLSEKFWVFFKNPLLLLDTAMSTLLTIHYNLFLGNIGKYAKNRPDFQKLISDGEEWKYNGHYFVTELGHGLDAINMETTCIFTVFLDGRKGFVLNTPHLFASKWMPPTTPIPGVAKIGLVFARLIVNEEFKGIRFFIVPLTNGLEMCSGVTSRFVGARSSSSPLDHSITSFDNVWLPLNSLVCDTMDILDEINQPLTQSIARIFTDLNYRVEPGKISITAIVLSSLKIATYINGKYSLWRTVGSVLKADGTLTDKSTNSVPIFTFRTQQIPLCYALAQSFVYSVWLDKVIEQFKDEQSYELPVRKAIGTVFKCTVVKNVLSSIHALSERCGAQGLFQHNYFNCLFETDRGIGIAEGDVLVVCIKVISEILLGRYSLPPPVDSSHILSQHETMLFDEYQKIIASFPATHSNHANKILFPVCERLAMVAGYRLAYEAAKASNVCEKLLDVFVSHAISRNSVWFSEKLGFTQEKQTVMRDTAIDKMLPNVESYLSSLNVESFVNVSILSPDHMKAFMSSLPLCKGNGCLSFDLFKPKSLL